MRLVIHDLEADVFPKLNISSDNTVIVAARGKYAPCVGCYKCWMKTPGQCIVTDRLQKMGALFGASSEVIVISENCYGGYSEYKAGL